MKGYFYFKHAVFGFACLLAISSSSFSQETATPSVNVVTTSVQTPFLGKVASLFNPRWSFCSRTDLKNIETYCAEGSQQLTQANRLNSILTICSILLVGGLLMSHRTTITRSYRQYAKPQLRSIKRRFKGFNNKKDKQVTSHKTAL